MRERLLRCLVTKQTQSLVIVQCNKLNYREPKEWLKPLGTWTGDLGHLAMC